MQSASRKHGYARFQRAVSAGDGLRSKKAHIETACGIIFADSIYDLSSVAEVSYRMKRQIMLERIQIKR